MQGKKPMTGKTSIESVRAPNEALPADADANRERRVSPRLEFEVRPASICIEQASGHAVSHPVAPRNLGRMGIGFVVGAFVPPQCPCTFQLTALDQSPVEIHGTVARCRHRRQGRFDAAVAFEQPIDLQRFIRITSAHAAWVRPSTSRKAVSSAAIVKLPDARGRLMRYYVQPTRLDAEGMTLIHGRTFKESATCPVVLFNEDGRRLEIPANVRRCQTVSKGTVEVELVFDASNDRRLGKSLGADHGESDEGVVERGKIVTHCESEPLLDVEEDLWVCESRALVLDEFDLDRHLLRALMTRFGLSVVDLPGVDANGSAANARWEDFDVVLIDVGACHSEALQAIHCHRESGYAGVIVATSAEEHASCRAASMGVDASAFLLKPFDHLQLRTLLERLLITEEVAPVRSTGKAILSTRGCERDFQPLIGEFVSNLSEYVTALHKALDQADYATVIDICRLLKGAGGSYGYARVTQAATSALEPLAAREPEARAVREAVQELIDIISRVRG